MELQRINLQDRLEKLSKVSGLEDVTAAGNLGLLDEPKAAVFNSRQGKTLISDSPWVENTINLCLKMVESSVAIVSSIGMTTWEIVTWKTGVSGGKLILLIPDTAVDLIKTISENIIVDFNLDPDKTLLLFPHPDAEPNEKYKRLPKRDFWIAALADRIYPVSVRSGGNMSRLVELYSILPDRVEEKFRVDYEKPSLSVFHPSQLPEIFPPQDTEWDYITHYTRSSNDPWPGETKAEYYNSIAVAGGSYSHDGCGTLRRILTGGRIRASSNLIRDGFNVVSLTECAPWDIPELIKWRNRLLRWTFEPYGIAFKRDKLIEMGARKVLYGYGYQYRFLNGDDRAFFQMNEPDGGNWKAEREWRFLGDLDLDLFGPEDAQVIVLKPEEAEELNEFSPFPVISWGEIGAAEEEEPQE